MDRIRLKDKEFELFIPESDIQAAIAKMAVQIKADVEGKNPLFVGVLNGALMFVRTGFFRDFLMFFGKFGQLFE